jgi:phage tail sheath protein FI
MNDLLYLGHDDPEPRNRTGLAALRSVQQISLLAIPGQGTTQVQGGLIAACEDSRYRFCVLDPRTPGDTLADVQAQRQAFDTKYAALYYPWLTIPDPMPDNLASIAQFPVPPSGHVLGLFARVDDERGVHKAPANEVVRGITGITRSLEKGEHDLLNPSPVNINVIRDFRPTGRSIRVWGTRCITSDTEHKYVPVRRLLIFVEQSIDIGLQWVVFEPNAEPLWARVTSSISNFLTDVWRSGALEGTKVEQAFFVRCDRTTMTQSDIDNGRLIILTGIAPVKPAEFVIIRMSLMTAVNET